MKSLLILAALVVAAPLAAHAETGRTPRALVSMAGLDLRNPADAALMIQRIEAAVRPICVAPGVAHRRTTAGCIQDLTRKTVKDLRVPELTLALEHRSASAKPVA
jgi:UrcA family protein